MIDLVGNRTMPDLLRERAERDPGKTWLVFEDREGTVTETSYGEFADQVDRAAAGLRSLGVGHGDRVLVHLHNCPEFLTAWFAAASLGAAMVPSNIANTAAEIAFIAARSKAAVIGVPHDRRGEAVKAFVVLEGGATTSAEVEFLTELPRTSVGKLAKGELRARESR